MMAIGLVNDFFLKEKASRIVLNLTLFIFFLVLRDADEIMRMLL